MVVSSFAIGDANFTGRAMVGMLSPGLQSVLKAHPDIGQEFISEIDKQVKTAKALRTEMAAEIETNLAAAVTGTAPRVASMGILEASSLTFTMQGIPAVSARRHRLVAKFL